MSEAAIIRFPLAERDCYACFDMLRAGPHNCPACGRPYGKRLPADDRPPPPPSPEIGEETK